MVSPPKKQQQQQQKRQAPTQLVLDEVRSWELQGKTPTDDWGKHSEVVGAFAMTKFFLPDLLPHHAKVILYDTDVLVGRPLSELWAEFATFTTDQVVGVALFDNSGYDDSVSAFPGTQGVCSCLSLMDLDKMRSIGWTMGSNWLRCLFFMQTIAGAAGYGDQALNTWVWARQPIVTKVISTTWINSGCQRYSGLRHPHPLVGQPDHKSLIGEAAEYESWGALHFNCWNGSREAHHKEEYAQVAAVWLHVNAQVEMGHHFRVCHAVNRTLKG